MDLQQTASSSSIATMNDDFNPLSDFNLVPSIPWTDDVTSMDAMFTTGSCTNMYAHNMINNTPATSIINLTNNHATNPTTAAPTSMPIYSLTNNNSNNNIWTGTPSTNYTVNTKKHTVPKMSIHPSLIAVNAFVDIFENEMFSCVIPIGERRTQANRKFGTTDLKFADGRRGVDIDYQGALGEYAFAKIHQLEIDLDNTTCRNAHNDTFDAVFPDGTTVDVKTMLNYGTHWPLRVPASKANNPAHLYALMIYENGERNAYIPDRVRDGHVPRLIFLGYVRGVDLFQPQNYELWKEKYYYRWPQNQLLSWNDIFG